MGNDDDAVVVVQLHPVVSLEKISKSRRRPNLCVSLSPKIAFESTFEPSTTPSTAHSFLPSCIHPLPYLNCSVVGVLSLLLRIDASACSDCIIDCIREY